MPGRRFATLAARRSSGSKPCGGAGSRGGSMCGGATRLLRGDFGGGAQLDEVVADPRDLFAAGFGREADAEPRALPAQHAVLLKRIADGDGGEAGAGTGAESDVLSDHADGE